MPFAIEKSEIFTGSLKGLMTTKTEGPVPYSDMNELTGGGEEILSDLKCILTYCLGFSYVQENAAATWLLS